MVGSVLGGFVTLAQLTVAWVVLSIPAYLVFSQLQLLRGRFENFLTWVRSRIEDRRRGRHERLQGAGQEFAEANSGLQFKSYYGQWLQTLQLLSEPTQALQASFDRRARTEEKLSHDLNRVSDSLQEVRSATAAIKITGDAKDILEELATHRTAIWKSGFKSVGSSVVLCALIVVNTGMLGQIIRDLGFIPAGLRFGVVPLYLIFALILTVIEAAFGFIHGVMREPSVPTIVRHLPPRKLQ